MWRPQGSILGPLLFVYVNDLSKCLKYAEMLLFAEDATILFTHQNSAEISEVHKKLLENNTKLVPSKQLANQCKYNKICNISQ